MSCASRRIKRSLRNEATMKRLRSILKSAAPLAQCFYSGPYGGGTFTQYQNDDDPSTV